MNKKFYLPLLLALLVVITGCKMGSMSSEDFSVNPNPLEVVAGKVEATITGVFPEKYFKKRVTVTVTPYLVYADGETAGTPFVYQGEKIVGNNEEIEYKMGGTITIRRVSGYARQPHRPSDGEELYERLHVLQDWSLQGRNSGI